MAFDRATFARRNSDDDSALRRNCWRKLRQVATQIPFAEDLLAAYYRAFDRATPSKVKAILVEAIAYLVLPFNAIPDMLPVISFTDDAAVLAIAIKLVADYILPVHRELARNFFG
jgi:uncharacterized membrane protein YkvA (DUF1232 family)